jgi:hypothetical protein
MRNLRLMVLTSALVLPAAAAAQTVYTRTAEDTLHYREVTIGEVVMETPRGAVPVRSEHDATIAVRFAPGDTAFAWYQSLHLVSAGPGGEQRPDTREMLSRPYVLRFSPRGHIVTLVAPPMPVPIGQITDLTRQFDDFFITLPDEPLVAGVSWADTVVRDDAGRPADSVATRHERTYVVKGDTAVDGTRAVVIEVHQRVWIEGRSPIEGQGLTAGTVLEGEDTGFAIFDPVRGELIARRRTGALTGRLSIIGGPEVIEMPQTFNYESSIERVRQSGGA